MVPHGKPFVLVGSVRDDGPLPDVYTDVIDGQRGDAGRSSPGVGFAIMVATMLHSVATGNLLPASVPLVCVDINPATVTKLADRGSSRRAASSPTSACSSSSSRASWPRDGARGGGRRTHPPECTTRSTTTGRWSLADRRSSRVTPRTSSATVCALLPGTRTDATPRPGPASTASIRRRGRHAVERRPGLPVDSGRGVGEPGSEHEPCRAVRRFVEITGDDQGRRSGAGAVRAGDPRADDAGVRHPLARVQRQVDADRGQPRSAQLDGGGRGAAVPGERPPDRQRERVRGHQVEPSAHEHGGATAGPPAAHPPQRALPSQATHARPLEPVPRDLLQAGDVAPQAAQDVGDGISVVAQVMDVVRHQSEQGAGRPTARGVHQSVPAQRLAQRLL